MMCDYFIVRRRQISLPSLFVLDKRSSYWYSRGFNPRAIIAFVCGVYVPHSLSYCQVCGP